MALAVAAAAAALWSASTIGDASSSIKMTIAEQAAKADAVVHGTVVQIDTKTLDDGFVVTLVRMSVTQVLRGEVPSGRLTLGLPGAYVDGQWSGVVGIPDVAVGDQLVVFGAAVNSTDVAMLGALQSVFRKKTTSFGEIAADFEGNPLVDAGCTAERLIARPLDQAPIVDQDGAQPDAVLAITSPGRVFLAAPDSAALPWEALITDLLTCIELQPASAGSATALGGGW